MQPLTAHQRQSVRRWRQLITGLEGLSDETLYSLQRRYMVAHSRNPDAIPWREYPNPLLFAEQLRAWGCWGRAICRAPDTTTDKATDTPPMTSP